MKNSRYYTMVATVLVLLSIVSCKSKSDQAKIEIKTYPVLRLTPSTAETATDFPATIQGIQNIEIRPKIDGYVAAIHIDEGASVKKGQLLFEIKAPQYEQDVNTALANIKIASAEVNAAQMQVEKVRPIVEQDIVSAYQLKSAQFSLESRRAALSQAKAALKNAQTNLSYTKIFSPSDGVIGILPYKIGSLVSSTTVSPLTTVSDISSIFAYFYVNERKGLDFFQAAKGKTMQEKLATLPAVTLVLANGSELPAKGRIQTASGLINAQTGALNMRATFPNPAGMVKSGSSAVVRIPEVITQALLIPQKATYQIQGKLFVYLVSNTHTVSSVPITVRAATGNSYVISSGLKPDDIIVADGISNLREGLKIHPQPISSQTANHTL